MNDWVKLMYEKQVIFESFEEFLQKIDFMIKDEIKFYHCFYKGKKTVTLRNQINLQSCTFEIINITPETFIINDISKNI